MWEILAMAGLAEGAAGIDLLIGFTALFIIWIVEIVALTRRSQIACCILVFLLLLSVVMFKPWIGFVPVNSDDPDVQSFIGPRRVFGIVWLIELIIAGLAAFQAYRSVDPTLVLSSSPKENGE
jgi:hypothetical protein